MNVVWYQGYKRSEGARRGLLEASTESVVRTWRILTWVLADTLNIRRREECDILFYCLYVPLDYWVLISVVSVRWGGDRSSCLPCPCVSLRYYEAVEEGESYI